MFVVTGATGQLGGQIVEQLLRRVDASQVGVSVRDVDRAAPLAARGVRVRRGDFTEPATLRHAFAGADAVLVVSAAIRGPGAVGANLAALDAARAAGARRILYTSHQASAPDSLFAPQLTHTATEDHLAGLGVRFAALRHGFYASTLGWMIAGALESGQLVAPADGPVSWTAHADLAEADAVILAEDRLDGITPALTGAESLDLAAVAGLLSDLSGRPVSRVVVEDDAWLAAAVAGGMPEPAARFTLGLYRASRRGEFDVVDPTLADLIGRPPTSVRSVLEGLIRG